MNANDLQAKFMSIIAIVALSLIFLFYNLSSSMVTLVDNVLRYGFYKLEELEYVVSTFDSGIQAKSPSQLRISIVMVITGGKGVAIYQKAILSVSCYAKVQGYDFRILKSSQYRDRCPLKDGFFQRHCVVAYTLPRYDYILYLDADMGVVNPKRRIEDYIDPKVDIIFYDRFYNWEITAGSYLVKNTTWSKEFLLNFARYEKRLPKSFDGTDNGALHAYIAEVVLGDNDVGLKFCMDLYNKSRNLHDLFLYEACIRRILGGDAYLGKIKILPKGTAWARDSWLTNSLWSLERDFIIHGWKENQLHTYRTVPVSIVSKSDSSWYNPLGGQIELSLCTKGNTTWHYDKNLLAPKNIIDDRLRDFARDVEKKQAKMHRKLPKKINNAWKKRKSNA